jgi:hypothetical protein
VEVINKMFLTDVMDSKCKWILVKFNSEEDYKANNPYQTVEIPVDGNIFERIIYKALKFLGLQTRGNLLLNEGINMLWTLVCSGGGTKFDASNAYMGVGSSDASALASQTGLTTALAYVGMDSGFPTFGTSQCATWRATFDGTHANGDWKEFTVANGNSDAAANLNRKVSIQGTKVSGQVWQVTFQIVLS